MTRHFLAPGSASPRQRGVVFGCLLMAAWSAAAACRRAAPSSPAGAPEAEMPTAVGSVAGVAPAGDSPPWCGTGRGQPDARCPAKGPPEPVAPPTAIVALASQELQVNSELSQAVFDRMAGAQGPLWVVLAADTPLLCQQIQHGAPWQAVLGRAAVQVIPAAPQTTALALPGPPPAPLRRPGRPAAPSPAAHETTRVRRALGPDGAAAMEAPVALEAGRAVVGRPGAGQALSAQPCPGLTAYLRAWQSSDQG